MPQKLKGTVEWVAPAEGQEQGHYRFRITLIDGARPWIPMAPGPRSKNAELRAREYATESSLKMRKAGKTAVDFGLKARGAQKPNPLAEAAVVAQPPEEAMETWLSVWLAARKAKGQTSTRENGSHYEHHIKDATGGRHVRAWTNDDLRRLSRELDAKVQAGGLKWKSAWNVWATASRICKDACSSKLDELRCRTDNPARDVAGPDRGAATAKQYLYPSEFLRFVTCDDVPLRWRRLVAIAIYLFPRAGELRVLRAQDVDLEHGVVHIHRARDRETGLAKSTKTKHARRFGIEPAIVPLLEAMRGDDEGSALVMTLPSERVMARALRRWLKRANVKREELHVDGPTHKKLTFHDLRATGITWMAIRGDDPLRIQQRAGHEDFTTTQGYIREAESVRDGFGEVFPPLPESLFGDDSEGPESSGESSAALLAELTTRNRCGVDGTRIGSGEPDQRNSPGDARTAASTRSPLPSPKPAIPRDPVRAGRIADDSRRLALAEEARALVATNPARARALLGELVGLLRGEGAAVVHLAAARAS